MKRFILPVISFLSINLFVLNLFAASDLRSHDVMVVNNDGTNMPFFPSMVKLPNNDLVAVYYWDDNHNFDGTGRIFFTKSTDGGHTWTTGKSIIDYTQSGLDSRDPNIALLSNGDLILNFFTGRIINHDDGSWYWKHPSRTRVVKLTYDGELRSEPVIVPTSKYTNSTKGPVLELQNGDLLVPTYGILAKDELESTAVTVSRSSDSGKTWGNEVTIASKDYKLNETVLAQTNDGTTYSISRPSGQMFSSTDNGHTWRLDKTTQKMEAPHLLKISDDKYFLTWCYRTSLRENRNVFGKIFYPGKAWDYTSDAMIYKTACEANWDMGYPSSALIDNSKLLTIYYDHLCTGAIYGTYTKLADWTEENIALKNNIIEQTPVNIGSRLELFIDDYLIDQLSGAELRLHHPEPKEIAMEYDAPWEGSGSGYNSVFKDGDLYRMYYKAWQHESASKEKTHSIYCCYAESKDGIHWEKPDLGLYEFEGSKHNNIVFIRGIMDGVNADGGHPAVFKDENPNVSPDALYKAFLRSQDENKKGVFAFKSPDGIHWKAMSKVPVISDGAFDSQNLAFWDNERGEYRAYWRYFDEETDSTRFKGFRSIRTATSRDFIHWENQADLEYVDSPREELYTNVIKPYYRAPHLFVGFPIRYTNRGWSESMKALPELEHRQWRSSIKERYGTAITESLLMVSRDGATFKRWNEAFLRPGIERKGTWNYGHQYLAWSPVVTKSALEGAPDELSFYAIENYWTGKSCSLRRYTLRVDGFVSVSANMKGGELITKPFVFTGSSLFLNFSSSAAGSIQVEIQDEAGKPISGYTLNECPPIFGDSLARIVNWEKGSELSALEGKTVKLRFVLKDADLFSIQFK